MDTRHEKVASTPRGVAAGLAAFLLIGSACSASPPDAISPGTAGEGASGAANEPEPYPADLPYARSVESFAPGDGAGFNRSKLPDIALGPPRGAGSGEGGLDVVSLGSGGEIVLGFGERSIVDGPGPDLIVFENPFWPNGDASQVFAELGEVSLSEDGESWLAFACDTEGDGQGHYPGCAGVTPTLAYDPVALVPLDPTQTGGDAFDLAELGLARARYVKLRDLATIEAAGNTSGFDLDAVGIVNVGD
jgi:hypothetical protein